MNSVWINGKTFLNPHILSGSYRHRILDSFENKVLNTVRDWERGVKTFIFKTSGSTGEPKSIKIERARMHLSAQATMDFLHLDSGSCLLCLDPEYIAGKMMIIRSLVRNMDLYALQPSSNPFKDLPEDISTDLCAIVPLQLYNILQNDSTRNKFKRVRNVLIGGADLSDELIKLIRPFPNHIYHTFGMTETVSHIALRRISGDTPDEYFKAVPGVKFRVDDRGCLVIHGEITGNMPFITNDRVELMDHSKFKWLGRIDHVINSGGVKIMVELLEKKIEIILKERQEYIPFFIAGIPDKKLGQKIAIILETGTKKVNKNHLQKILKNKIDAYEMPKHWRFIPAFIRTASQKMDRNRSLEISTEIN